MDHKGTAKCKAGHEWPCQWWVEEKPSSSGIMLAERKVTPHYCPHCKDKWKEVKPL